MQTVSKQTVLITGAGSGLGLCCAEAFAHCGNTVIGVSRHCKAEVRKCGCGEIRTMPMDVNDEESIRAVVGTLDRIDIVLHCAGFGIAGACEDTPSALAHAQMETNYFGVLRVNAQVLPKMRAQGSGLVLLVSSIAGRIGIPFQSHYSASKFALEAYAQCLRMEVEPFGIRVSVIEPGDTKTGFTGARSKALTESSPYYARCARSVAKMEHDEQNGKPPESVAKTALRLAARKNPPLRVAVGAEYKALMGLKRVLPDRLLLKILTALYAK